MHRKYSIVASVLALVGAPGCAALSPRHEPPENTFPAAITAQTQPVRSAAASLDIGIEVQASPGGIGQGLPARDNETAVTRLLAYADRVRSMTPAELAPEFARLSDTRSPAEQMQLSLALAQVRQTPELVRAQDLLTRVLANASPEAMAYHPLARFLATRFGEQRRFEDLFDKQVQQTRDTQRRLDQTAERLAALKAIERSLGVRTPATTAPMTSNNSKNPEKSARPRSAP